MHGKMSRRPSMHSQPTYSDKGRSPQSRSALALLSGGLDSALAIYLVKQQGIDVVGVHFTSFFATADPSGKDSPVIRTAGQLGVPVHFQTKGDDFLEIIRSPRYGYGKNLNPCIDCRIYTLKRTRDLLKQFGASFIVTGEVVGQRPMSQRRNTLRLIEKQAECEGLVLRPLSAKSLPVTIPEERRIVDREQLLGITGRGRKTQLRLASEIGLTGFQAPAGGCLLTDKGFTARLRDLLQDGTELSQADLQLLSIGRHMRLRPGLKIVIGRDEKDNDTLEHFAARHMTMTPVDFPGPVVVVQGRPQYPEEELLIARILKRYAKKGQLNDSVCVKVPGEPERFLRAGERAGEQWTAQRLI